MDRKYSTTAVLIALVMLVVVVGLGAAFYTGVGPAPGGNSGDDIDEFPIAEDADDGETEASSLDESDPFTFEINEIEECGQTCRDVTSTLNNNQDQTATNVTVYIRIFAGEDNTDTDDIVWEGTEDVGTLEAGGSHSTTERVELSIQEARMIDDEDGWVTILTTVESDDTIVTYQEIEQVA